MNKHTVITAIAIITIIIPFVYSGMNVYAAEQLVYKWTEPGQFSFFEMSNNRSIELCNTVSFPANFKSFEITAVYESENKGTYTVNDVNMGSLESKIVKGKFTSDNFVDTQRIFMVMDFEFDGGDNRIDVSQLFVHVNIETPIIGIIPYSVSTQYPGISFDELMNQNIEC